MRESVRQPRTGGERDTPTRTPRPANGPQAELLRIQRLAGNAAAVQAVQSGQTAPGQVAPVVQRDPATRAVADQALTEAGKASGAAADAQAAAGKAQTTADDALAKANAALDNEKLNQLRILASSYLGMAFTAYVSACKNVKDSIKAAAKQNAEMIALVLDVAMGFASPALAKGLAGMASRLPVGATTLEYRLAIAALNTDNTKALLVGATKAAGQTLKSNATALAGESDVDTMIKQLEVNAQVAFGQAIEGVNQNTNAAQIGAVAAAYHPTITNTVHYEAEIKKLCDLYARDVRAIGATSMATTQALPPMAVWVEDGGAKRLAIVQYHPGLFGIWGNRYMFFNWVSDEMKDLAVSKQKSDFGRIETIKRDELTLAGP